MSERDAMRMTEEEVAGFLADHFRGQFATINRDGTPHLVPISYCLVDGEVAFWTDPGSQKTVNIERDPRVAVLVEDGTDFQELRGVQLNGRAVLRQDEAITTAVADAFLARTPGEAPEGMREMMLALGRQRVTVVVKVDKVVSWDHRKLGGQARAEDIGK